MGRIEQDYYVFEWDDKKSRSNLTKHGIMLEDAISAFYDPNAVTQIHQIVDGEQRWRTLGISRDTVLLFVGHLIFDDEEEREVIRLITAREATQAEEDIYYGYY